MLKNKLYSVMLFLLLLAFHAWIMHVIFLTHTNVAFWLQSDNSWAPHFVYDLVYQHHSIHDWFFANGTIHLLDTLPFFAFSIFTANMQTWIYLNAIFNLTLYFVIFYALARILFKDLNSQIFVILAGWLSLILLIYHKLILFTLDLLLISAEHMTQMLVALLSLIIVLKILKQSPKIIVLWILLALLVTLGVFSDEILSASFTAPIILALLIFYLKEPNKLYLKLLACITLSTFVGRLLWDLAPLNFERFSFVLKPHLWTLMDAIGVFFAGLLYSNPGVIIVLFLFLPFSIITIIYMWKRKNQAGEFPVPKLWLFTSIYILGVWLSGIGRMTVNYHVPLFQYVYDHFHFYSRFYSVAVVRDSIDLFIMPLFIGIPILILSLFSFLSASLRTKLLIVINTASLLIFSGLLLYKEYTLRPRDSLKAQVHAETTIVRCLQANRQRYHLHVGVANYWNYRPIFLLSNGSIPMAAIYSGDQVSYEHYLTTWQDIQHQQVDYWVVSYDKFFNDPSYTNFYDEGGKNFSDQNDIQYKLSHFGKPDGEFTCQAADGHKLQAYIYRHGQIMRHLLPSIKLQGKEKSYINSRNEFELN